MANTTNLRIDMLEIENSCFVFESTSHLSYQAHSCAGHNFHRLPQTFNYNQIYFYNKYEVLSWTFANLFIELSR